ncbi:MAG: 2-iminobutanoate/2-iminopropanoate deaminase, partial [Patescibacteria group bacterium]|nr:2-iminobutanoate/2-iminopropanoate deaminase [Patescibacteria group bacterium]
GIKPQTKQVILNLKAVLATKNLNLENLVKTTVYLSDMTYFAPMNEVYANYFENIKPARATIAVSELPRVGGDVDIVIEIDAVACKGDQNE